MNTQSFILAILFLGTSMYTTAQKITDKYGHFTGTTESHINVVLDMTLAGSRAEGIFSFFNRNDSLDKMVAIPVDGIWDGLKKKLNLVETNNPVGSVFSFSTDDFINLRGWWSSGEDSIKSNCELAETYPRGSIQFSTYSKALSQTLFPMLKDSPRASYRIVVMEAGKGATDHILDSVNLHMQRLVFNREPIGEAFDTLIRQESSRYFKQYIEQNTDNFTVNNSSNNFCWDKHQTVSILHNADFRLSFGVKNYAFSGSGKGMTVKKYSNVSLKDGALIALKDLFRDGYEQILQPLILAETKKKYLGNKSGSLVKAGFYSEELKPTENFYITSQSIVFVYNPYEVASPEVGAVEVMIPFTKLNDILLLSK